MPERRHGRAWAALVVVATLSLAGCGGTEGGGTTAADGQRFVVAEPLPPGLAGKPAPRMQLVDARLGSFDSRSLTGKPYLVTFLFVNCPDVCPLIGQEIRVAFERLGADADRVGALAVSVDPRGDTPEAVRTWLRRQRAPQQLQYLIGAEVELEPVWKAWYAAPQIAGNPDSAHSAVVWLVDAEGKLAGKVPAGAAFDPDGLAEDLRALLPDEG